MVEGPVSSRRFSRRQVRSLLLTGGGIIVALVVAVGAWHIYGTMRESAAEEEKRRLTEIAEQQAGRVATPFQELDKRLGTLAKEPALVALFRSADSDKLAGAGDQYLSGLDSGLKLRLLLPGKYELDNESTPPLGYGSLDLLRQAEAGAAEGDAR